MKNSSQIKKTLLELGVNVKSVQKARGCYPKGSFNIQGNFDRDQREIILDFLFTHNGRQLGNIRMGRDMHKFLLSEQGIFGVSF